MAEEDAHLADPEKVFQFLENVPVDCFAPAIGTAHGVYKGEPKIAFDRIKIIGEGTSTPLALHGGTGLADEVFTECIALGCSKVNISTQLKYAFIDGFVDYHSANPKKYDPLKVLEAQYEALVDKIIPDVKHFSKK